MNIIAETSSTRHNGTPQQPIDVDIEAMHGRAMAARNRAGGDCEAGDAAYLATVEEALRTLPAPFAEVARRVLDVDSPAARHRPWCDTTACRSFIDVDGRTPVNDHYGPTVIVGEVSVALEWHPTSDGRGEPTIYMDKVDLSPAQARTLGAELLRLASLAEASPQRAALRDAVDTKDGVR